MSRSYRFPVEAGHMALFARSLGDTLPAHIDPFADDLTAAPTFTQAADHYDPEYDRRLVPGEDWYDSGREPLGKAPPPGEGGGLGFHAEQEFEYHRPIVPGQMLTATVSTGRRWEKEGRRGGKLTFTETLTEFHDDSGELIVTARFIGVGTEKQVN